MSKAERIENLTWTKQNKTFSEWHSRLREVIISRFGYRVTSLYDPDWLSIYNRGVTVVAAIKATMDERGHVYKS